jgi:hypothetical protein
VASKPRRASSISRPWRSVLTLPYSSSSNCIRNSPAGASVAIHGSSGSASAASSSLALRCDGILHTSMRRFVSLNLGSALLLPPRLLRVRTRLLFDFSSPASLMGTSGEFRCTEDVIAGSALLITLMLLAACARKLVSGTDRSGRRTVVACTHGPTRRHGMALWASARARRDEQHGGGVRASSSASPPAFNRALACSSAFHCRR